MTAVFQYKAPVKRALPSLSTEGAVDLEPKYRSSKASYEAAALVSLVAALLALVEALEAHLSLGRSSQVLVRLQRVMVLQRQVTLLM